MELDALQSTLALVARAAADSEPAFADLYRRCVDGVRQSALLRLGARGSEYRDDVEDVLQEVFAAAFDAIRRGAFDAARTDGGFRNWLASVVQAKVIDNLRRRTAGKRGGGKVQALDAMGSSMLGAIPAAAADSVGRRERAERLRAAMLELPDNYRRVLDLHYLCQMAYEDVAQQLGYQRVEPVRLLAHRARVALGGLLGVGEWRPE